FDFGRHLPGNERREIRIGCQGPHVVERQGRRLLAGVCRALLRRRRHARRGFGRGGFGRGGFGRGCRLSRRGVLRRVGRRRRVVLGRACARLCLAPRPAAQETVVPRV